MLKRLVGRLVGVPFLTVIMGLMSIAMVAVVGTYLVGLDSPVDADGDVVIGDFPAFHTGAALIASDRGSSLYDLEAQFDTQMTSLGRESPDWQAFINPPGLAVGMSPLGSLDLVTALRWFSVVIIASMAATLWLWRRVLPTLTTRRLGWATVALTMVAWPPFARMIPGGQTAPIALLLLTCVYLGDRRDNAILSGVALGLLTYKPQYVVIVGLALLVRRRWVAIGIASSIAVLHFVIGGLVVGWDWPVLYLDALDEYGPIERASNLKNQISLVGSLDYAVGGVARGWLAKAGAVVIGAAIVADLWRRTPEVMGGEAGDSDHALDTRVSLWWASVLVATLFVSMHTMYYDAVLLALPVALGIDAVTARAAAGGRALSVGAQVGIIGVWLSHLLVDLAPTVGFQPLALVAPALYLWLRNESKAVSRGVGV